MAQQDDTRLSAAFGELHHALFTAADNTKEKVSNWQAWRDECVVVLPAGGEGLRMKGLIAEPKVNKVSLELPAGGTMFERTIQLYKDAGFTRFVALLYHEPESVVCSGSAEMTTF